MADVLLGKKDPYSGLTVRLSRDDLRRSSADFGAVLEASMAEWRADGVRGVWLRLPTKSAAARGFVAPAIAAGFEFHHAKPGYAMMTAWLPAVTEAAPNTLPLYPHHQVGVGGMVLDASGTRVLAIQEKAGNTGFWKLPGGLVDPREDLAGAACREVLEETGVAATFLGLCAFRESHAGPFGSTDLYAVAALRLDAGSYGEGNTEPPMPSPQEREIARAEWLPLAEFLNLPYYAGDGLFGTLLRAAAETTMAMRAAAGLAAPAVGGSGEGDTARRGQGLVASRLPLVFRKGSETLYHSAASEAVRAAKAKL
jgi:8-oxo-dGTP pyrophosphatase MutT (NUDIX family)